MYLRLMGQPARMSVMLEKKIPSCCIENTNRLLKEFMNKKKIKQVEKRFFAKTSSWNPFQAYHLELRIIYSSCNTKYDKGKHTACFSICSKRKCFSLSWNKGTKNILSTAAAKYFVQTKPLDTRNKQFCHIKLLHSQFCNSFQEEPVTKFLLDLRTVQWQ